MNLVFSIALTVIGAIWLARSIKAKGEKPFSGLVGLAVFAIGAVWTLVLIGRGLVEGIFFVAGTIAAIAALGYLGYWFIGRFLRRTRAKLVSGEDRKSYLGKTGSALTPLRPAGVAMVDGIRIDVATEGEFIAAGSRIKVVAMDTRRYFVRLADS